MGIYVNFDLFCYNHVLTKYVQVTLVANFENFLASGGPNFA